MILIIWGHDEKDIPKTPSPIVHPRDIPKKYWHLQPSKDTTHPSILYIML